MAEVKQATLHERILSELRDNILRGIWPPGHHIPFETEMAAAYGVSRMTVNKVLTQLTREGYLERRRKSGTFVAKPRGQSAVMTIANLGDEARQRGGAYSFDLLKQTTRAIDAANIDQLRSAKAGLPVLELEYVHHSDGEPFCHEHRIINLAAVPAAGQVDFKVEQAGTWLLRKIPWSSAEHIIRAVNPAQIIARHLGVPASTACLEVERRTEFEGHPITFARLTYPGSKHQLVARFAPQSGAKAP